VPPLRGPWQSAEPLISLRAWAPCCGAGSAVGGEAGPPLDSRGPCNQWPTHHEPWPQRSPAWARSRNRLLRPLADERGLPAAAAPPPEIWQATGRWAHSALPRCWRRTPCRGDGLSASAPEPAQGRAPTRPWPVVRRRWRRRLNRGSRSRPTPMASEISASQTDLWVLISVGVVAAPCC